MGFWSFIFGEKTDDALENYVERPYYFKSSPSVVIGLSAQGTSGDLTQQQDKFIKQLERDYLLLVKTIIPGIEIEVRNREPGFKILNFEQEFWPAYLVIPDCKQQPIKWGISFFGISDASDFVSVNFIDYQPTKFIVSAKAPALPVP
ncbi:hypothetical protein [Hymenobacter cheonanensis]|uniref:hypothetical protein n=1 Tax=Hymenobacter sp. CA2-7 TaxID=3063993 RepID=UPI00271222D6|nr:hypothetical protein [Hymenobacter sp. CA2-7]MDO7886205.1 hypothetical protein [Hymenobacter sp. CA2-7]